MNCSSPPSKNEYGPPGSFHGTLDDYNPYPPAPGSYYIEDRPQHFYKWLSPPGIIKIMMATVIVLCVAIFACVASTLMWDMDYAYGGMGYGMGYGGGYSGGGYGSGYGSYGGGYGNYGSYGGSYVSPYSAKTAMIAMAAINFIGSLVFFITSFSKSLHKHNLSPCLQGIISIVYIVGVNPMAQGSSSMMYNPMLMMCQNLYQTSYSQMGGVGGFPIYNQYLYHYCFVDPQEVIAMVCGFLVVIALGVSAFYAHKTRGKIWRYGKPNIYWEEPLVGGKASEGRDVEEWPVPVVSCLPKVNNVEENRSVQDAPTLLVSEKGAGLLNASANSVISYPAAKGDSSSFDGDTYNNEMYPAITSDAQRQDYKREFDADLKDYKRMCADMDDINDQLNKLSRQLDTLDETSAKYQVRYYTILLGKSTLCTNLPFDLTKKQCRRLRHKLFHVKRMVKNYDKSHS
uniref:Si:ch73-61d6.3 n=1 Tax=Neogobius melanostomus TaxID=47308 RepID=A0A8C6WZN2_9GOBI